MTRERCRSCNAEIVWARTSKARWMPVDVEPSPDGNVVLSDVGGQVHAAVTSGAQLGLEPLHKAHFATCADASAWRK